MATWQLRPARAGARGIPLRALLLLSTLVVLLIVGLLGMHALAGSTGGHTPSVAAHSGGTHGSTSVEAAAAHADPECAQACAAPLGHEHAAVACVLALLAGLLLLTPPRSIARAWLPTVSAITALAAGWTQVPSPTPSLIQLSISRT
ncbi:DUF6153 family protein [Agrococcus sp. Ld7]|uniref:DUF6153 family protein n=1 Tax=Agrococcus sp. Ld7 TaxID=649148 RepID=UPI00386D004D